MRGDDVRSTVCLDASVELDAEGIGGGCIDFNFVYAVEGGYGVLSCGGPDVGTEIGIDVKELGFKGIRFQDRLGNSI